MAESILTYAAGQPGKQQTSTGVDYDKLTQGINSILEYGSMAVQQSKLRGIQDSKAAATEDVLLDTIDPKRREQEAAYDAVVTRNELFTIHTKVAHEMQNEQSRIYEQTPEEFNKGLMQQHRDWHANNKGPNAKTNAIVYNEFMAKARPGLIAAHAAGYKKRRKHNMAIEATKGLAALPPGDEADYIENTSRFIDNSLPVDMFTTEERLQIMLAAATSSAMNGDGRLKDYLEKNTDAATLYPERLAAIGSKLTNWQREQTDLFFAGQFKKNELAAEGGIYSEAQFNKDTTDPERIRRFGQQPYQWRRTSRKANVNMTTMREHRGNFRAENSMLGIAPKERQKIYDMELGDMLEAAKQNGASELDVWKTFATKVAAQDVPSNKIRDMLSAGLSRPHFTEEQLNHPQVVDAIAIAEVMSDVMSPEQLIDQLGGQEAYKNFVAIRQSIEDAGGDPEKAAKIYLNQKQRQADQPELQHKNRLEDRALSESVQNIVDGSIKGSSDPALNRFFQWGSSAGDAVFKGQIEYALQNHFGVGKAAGMSDKAATEYAEKMAASELKFFGNELHQTKGASMNSVLGLDIDANADTRDEAFEHICSILGLDPDETHVNMNGGFMTLSGPDGVGLNQQFDTDGDGTLDGNTLRFPAFVVGKLHSIAVHEERQLKHAEDEAQRMIDAEDNNRWLEQSLNNQYGEFNDKAKFLADGTTVGEYKDANTDERIRMRNQYLSEQREWLRPFLEPVLKLRDKIASGAYTEAEKDRFRTTPGNAGPEDPVFGKEASTQEKEAEMEKERQQLERAAEATKVVMPRIEAQAPSLRKKPVEFKQKIVETAEAIGIEPEALSAIIKTESNFNHKAKNPAKGSTAYGLIQFTDVALKDLGVKPAELRKMGPNEQLELTAKWFKLWESRGKKVKDVADMYMTVFQPAAIGQPDDFVIARRGEKAYKNNRRYDRNGDGTITKAEAAQDVIDVYNKMKG